MYVVFRYGDEKYISGLRKNAIFMCKDRSDAILFPDQRSACAFILVLLRLLDEDAVYTTVKYI